MSKTPHFMILLFVILWLAIPVAFSQSDPCASLGSSGLQNVCKTVMNVCSGVRSLIPPVAMLMIMGSGVVYAGGQFTGAETRARANVWSTNMLVGAIMGLIIATVGPAIINLLWQSSVSGATTITC